MMGMGILGSCHSFPALTSTFWSGLFLDLGFTYWKHTRGSPGHHVAKQQGKDTRESWHPWEFFQPVFG